MKTQFPHCVWRVESLKTRRDVGKMCRTIALRLCIGIKRFQHVLRVVPWRLAYEAGEVIDAEMKGQLGMLSFANIDISVRGEFSLESKLKPGSKRRCA